MKRFEAGQRPPQQPREQQGRLTALPSRARDFFSRRHHPSFEQTLQAITPRPVFDDAVVLNVTREEFSRVHTSLPQEPTFPQTLRIIAPGMENGVKNRRLREIIPKGVAIERFPQAEEEHNLDTVADGLSKARSAAMLADAREDLRRPVRKGELVSIGVDVLTDAFVHDAKGARYERLGKPESIAEVRELFLNAHNVVQADHLSGYPYMTEVATVIHNPFYPNRDAWTVRRALVILSPQLLEYLATPEGFAEYQERARIILNCLHQPTDHDKTILNTAGGFVIEAFREMMEGKGIQTVITDPNELTPANMLHKPFDEDAYRQAESIAQGHADEALIHDYCQRFQRASSLVN
ncbi:MAG TPA: hypothetical protein VN711_00725 [Candidatus Saccharimonadales bacterium]|nr:hypothetical protein [Candidatus Saccharimonadales bacterium]